MKKFKQRKGITLIALVLTIIVLLILAGITINLTIGQDGILKRAEEAGKNYTQAAEKEKTELAKFSNLTDKIIDNVTKNHYTMVNGVPVPKGFSHKEGTKDTGFVIKNDTDGNEFVWVPVDRATSYKYERVAFSREGWSYNQTLSDFDASSQSYKITRADTSDVWTEKILRDEETSVQTYGGFYIGRYESGVSGYNSSVADSNSSNSTEWTGYSNGKLVIQKDQQVWNYITRDKAKKVSEGLYSKTNGDSVNSKLCSSYAWDTALKFIETKNIGYATSSDKGNYKDKTFSYIDLDGTIKTKETNTTVLVPTGQTIAVNNIYDIGGNVYEWTTEVCSKDNSNYVSRGGAYNNTYEGSPVAIRLCHSTEYADINFGFRTTLYL